jgi:P27 family predicted phage terminase small subunit
MKGRKPHPTVLRMLRGNPGKRPAPPKEPQPTPVTNAAAPDWLDADAQAEWRRVAPMLERTGVLTESDLDALAAYCEAWVTWKGATQKIRQFGMVIKGPRDIPIQSPYVRIAHNALQSMRGLLVEFGMTPSSRVRVAATPKPTTDSKWANLT